MPPKRGRKRKAGENLLELSQGDGGTDVATIRTVLEKDGSFKTHVQDLAELARDDKHSAVATLINLLMECCGVKQTTVEAREIQENASDPKRILVEIAERIPRTASEKYPLASKDKKWDKFKYNFPLFWKSLIVQLEAKEALYDSEFADLLITWVGGLCQSPFRVFRHHATLAAYSMIGALCKLAVDLESLSTQLVAGEGDGEGSPKKRKITKKRATLRGKDAEVEVRNKTTAVNRIITEFYSATCEMRIKDVLPQIRVLSVESQGKWSLLHPSIFIKEEYTKRLSPPLSDENEAVRYAALCALEKLYKKDGMFVKLQGFTNRFKLRFVEMTLDVSRQTTVKALEVIAILLDHQKSRKQEIFQTSILEGFLEHVFHERQSVRRAGGRVFNCILSRRVQDVMKQEAGGSQPPAKDVAERKLNEIVRWLAESHAQGSETAADGVVEALTWSEAVSGEKSSIFTHFEHIASIASAADPSDILGKRKTKTKSVETNLLVRAALTLLFSVLKFASGALDLKVVSNDPAPGLTKAQKKKKDALWHDVGPKSTSIYSRMRAFFPEYMATMLEESKTSPELVRDLCGMFACLDVDLWAEGGKKGEKTLKETLLPSVRDCFFIATDEATLTSICWVYKILIKKPNPHEQYVQEQWLGVFEELMRTRTRKTATFWKKLALAVEEVPCDFLGHEEGLWKLVVEDNLMDPALADKPHAGYVVSAAASLLFLRTYCVLKKRDSEGIRLEQDFPDVAGCLLQLLPSAKISLEVKETVLHALSDTWVLGCTNDLLGKPKTSSQKAFMDLFDELVPDDPGKGQIPSLELARILKRSESCIAAFSRLWALHLLDEAMVARVFIKWPLLHTKAQEMVKRLNSILQTEAWVHEANAIVEANERYLHVEDDKVESAETVLKLLCRRLSQLNMGKGGTAAANILLALEEYAAKSPSHYFVLYAASPYVRYLTAPDASMILQKIRTKEYDSSDAMIECVTHFINQLQRRSDDPKAGLDDDDDDEDDKKKGPAGRAKPNVLRGSRHSTIPAQSSKRTVRGLDYDDDKKEKGRKAKRGRDDTEPSTASPKKKQKTTRRLDIDEDAVSEEIAPPKPASQKKAKSTLPSPPKAKSEPDSLPTESSKRLRLSDHQLSFQMDDTDDDDDEDEKETPEKPSQSSKRSQKSAYVMSQRFDESDSEEDEGKNLFDTQTKVSSTHTSQESVHFATRRRRHGEVVTSDNKKLSSNSNGQIFPSTEEAENEDDEEDEGSEEESEVGVKVTFDKSSRSTPSSGRVTEGAKSMRQQ